MVRDEGHAPSQRNYPRNQPLLTTHRLAWAAVGLIAYGAAGLVGNVPRLVESVYATSAPPVVWLLSRLSGIVPISLTEVIYVAYFGWLVWMTATTSRFVVRGDRSVRNAIGGGVTRLARDAGIVVFLFYVMWGFNYARPSLESRFGWPAWTPGDVAELTQLSRDLIARGNEAYLEIHGTEDAGHPTVLPDGLREIHATLERSYARVATDLPLHRSMRWRYGRTKYLASSAIYARLGITGFYFPFTAEANVRWGLPALSLPQSVAHEKAHQRGIASEDEASFVGFVAGMLSDDPHARYSSIMFAQIQLTTALARADREQWRELATDIIPGVRRDLDDMRDYFRRFVGVGTAVGRSVNDRFLRANRVEGGVLSYGRVARLLITYSREQDGILVHPRP